MKALHLSLIAIAGIGVIISSCFPNVYAPCVIGSTGARLCAGSDLNDSMDESNYKNIESLGSAITSAVDQAESNATLLIYTDVPWQGTLSTSTNSTMLSGNSADSQYSFACNYNDTYFITLGSAGRTETARGIWTVANVIQDGKMLDIGVNRLANGRLNLSGQCHTAQFPMSNTGMVSFTTDKTIYQYGDTIQISGVVLPDLQRSFYVLTSTIV
ncbi:MAG TPA: hypothetical protein VK431_03105, partial [Nitrosopumilaceae archaeon]|nr:hypothetical protein [Nitrosopumilaceae archaeon]